jgi:hypothetical protein
MSSFNPTMHERSAEPNLAKKNEYLRFPDGNGHSLVELYTRHAGYLLENVDTVYNHSDKLKPEDRILSQMWNYFKSNNKDAAVVPKTTSIVANVTTDSNSLYLCLNHEYSIPKSARCDGVWDCMRLPVAVVVVEIRCCPHI